MSIFYCKNIHLFINAWINTWLPVGDCVGPEFSGYKPSSEVGSLAVQISTVADSGNTQLVLL